MATSILQHPDSPSPVYTGQLIHPELCQGQDVAGCHVRELLAAGRGSNMITALRVDLPPGRVWSPAAFDLETIVVVFNGRGELHLGQEHHALLPASTAYAPTGTPFRLSAVPTFPLTVYLWRASLLPDRRPSRSPLLVSTLWDETTSFRPKVGE